MLSVKKVVCFLNPSEYDILQQKMLYAILKKSIRKKGTEGYGTWRYSVAAVEVEENTDQR